MIHRRTWISGLLGCAAALGWDEPEAASDDAMQAEIEDRGKRAGLPAFRASRTASYLGVGDAPDLFRTAALQTCETLALDYLDHFKALGFPVKAPAQRLVVVTLADRRSFLAFLGKDLSANVIGIYSRGANLLMVYDNRAGNERDRVTRGRFFNHVSLAHEAMHQLTFNTGLLNRVGDIPLAIIEGLALYGETRRTTGRTPPGLVNQERLRTLAYRQRQGMTWTPVKQLLVDDHLVQDADDAKRSDFSYAQSWLLVHYLLKTPDRLPQMREYLQAVFERKDASQRLEDAQAHFGDLARLDAHVRAYAVKLLKGER
jgi:uncharacterized protein DUF1570